MSDEAGDARPKLILASRSPRRRELLQEAGYRFEVRVPAGAVEDGLRPGESPAELVARLAFQKAADVARQVLADQGPPRGTVPFSGRRCASLPENWDSPRATEGDSPIFAPRRCASVGRKSGQSPGQVAEGWILGCDTVVECEGRILGKPADREDARQMLRAKRPLAAGVDGPVPVANAARLAAGPRGRHHASHGSPRAEQLEEYLASGQWEGKAGAFGYQDRLGWVHVLQGSESNVVGLPLELLAEMLDSAP